MKSRGSTGSVAIVGGETLLAREIREVLAEESPRIEIRLVGDEAETAILTERNGEPVVVSTLDQASITSADAVILTGSPESSRRAVDIVSEAGAKPAVIDLTQASDGWPDVRLEAPLVEVLASQALGGKSARARNRPRSGTVYQIAHPAAIVTAEFLTKLHRAKPFRHALVHIFEPASERGREGIDELQKQTVSLLSFKPLPQEVFDAQLSFNMLPSYGAGAVVNLQAIEARIVRHLKALLDRMGGAPLPSVRLVQAPVFHGYSFSVWAEFEAPADSKDLIRALADDRIEIRSRGEAPATNVGVAGQSGMTVSRIEADSQRPNAAWLWVVADNHRVTAENATYLARLLIPSEGRA